MNIFEVLNQGNSRLHEPSISAMLGYLLDTRRDHGLGDTFFREFLSLLNKENDDKRFSKYLEKSFIDTDILLEEPYELNGSDKYIDIQASIFKKDSQENSEDFRLIIENKIKDSSTSKGQLNSYYQAIIQDDSTIDNLSIIFLTPSSNRKSLKTEFQNLDLQNSNHVKCWIRWNEKENSIIKILKKILRKESEGEINPINEYTRHTIKAFILFLNATVTSTSERTYRFGEDIGEIIESIEVTLNGEKEYRIVRRDSQQIQVFQNEEKVTAKPILRSVIKSKNLDVPLSGINTRTMGRKVIEELK